MKRSIGQLGLSVLLCGSQKAIAEPIGWLALEDIKVANYRLNEQWLIPTDVAVRVTDGRAEYNVNWEKNPGNPFGSAVYPLSSRAAAEEMIELHRDPDQNASMFDPLCLTKFAREKDAGNEFYASTNALSDTPK